MSLRVPIWTHFGFSAFSAFSAFSVPPRIYLTGFMASGKSTVGPLLADRLGYRFLDLDWLVTARMGRDIDALFAEGEHVFRAAEAEALTETTKRDGLVVATGGGTLVDSRNLTTARMAGAVVWLHASAGAVLARLGDASGRPVLAGEDGMPLQGAALADRVRDLASAREPFYAQADRVVDADAPAEAVAREVAESLRSWRRGPGQAN